MADTIQGNVEQNVFLENRSKLRMSGITEILNFDDETITVSTSFGRLIIKGAGLKIINFVTETGDMETEGKINAIVYLNDTKGKNSLMGKIFR